jgi:hypothetical protein
VCASSWITCHVPCVGLRTERGSGVPYCASLSIHFNFLLVFACFLSTGLIKLWPAGESTSQYFIIISYQYFQSSQLRIGKLWHPSHSIPGSFIVTRKPRLAVTFGALPTSLQDKERHQICYRLMTIFLSSSKIGSIGLKHHAKSLEMEGNQCLRIQLTVLKSAQCCLRRSSNQQDVIAILCLRIKFTYQSTGTRQ